jgi:hypothetical protein
MNAINAYVKPNNRKNLVFCKSAILLMSPSGAMPSLIKLPTLGHGNTDGRTWARHKTRSAVTECQIVYSLPENWEQNTH